jgi:hypothetical protein
MANITQQGSQLMLATILEGGTIAANNTWIGLASGTLSNTSTLATITEVGGTRKNVLSTNWSETNGTAAMAAVVTWGTGVATYWFLCDVSTGTAGNLIAYGALSTTRSITTADTLTEQITALSIS